MSKTKKFPKKLTHTTPELLGLNNNIKTRSLRVIDFLNNNNLLPNDNSSNRIVAYVTGLSQNDFINPPIINQRFKKLFEAGKIFQNHIPTFNEQPLHTFAEIKDLFKAAKKAVKNSGRNYQKILK